LMDAECEVEVGSLATAMGYVNQVRARAANPTGWVYKNSAYDAVAGKYTVQTTPADTYKVGQYASFPDKTFARKAVQFERMIELAMEGHRFFDLQRWNTGGSMAETLNAFIT